MKMSQSVDTFQVSISHNSAGMIRIMYLNGSESSSLIWEYKYLPVLDMIDVSDKLIDSDICILARGPQAIITYIKATVVDCKRLINAVNNAVGKDLFSIDDAYEIYGGMV